MNKKDFIKENKIIVVLRALEEDELLKIVDTIYKAGIRTVEIAIDQKNKNMLDYLKKLDKLRNIYDTKMIVGSGTVLELEDAKEVIKAGSEIIVSPNLNRKVVEYATEKKILTMPGAMTPTEAAQCHYSKATFVKLFPAGLLGKDYVEAIKKPLSQIEFSVFGNITLENIVDFKKVGINLFGLGSQLLNPKFIKNKEYEKLEEHARKFVDLVK